MTRELILLSPYTLPTHNTLMLNADDVAVFLNGYLALWHPAALQGAIAPPKIASPYDHEQPSAGFIYAVPESPPLFLPDDWDQRVAAAGAVSFRATSNRQDTLTNLMSNLGASSWPSKGAEQSFIALGFGYVVLNALFEAMDHVNHLSVDDFWQEITQALNVSEAEERERALQAAAGRLREAREVLYPSAILLVDMALLDDVRAQDVPTSALDLGSPINFIASGETWEKIKQSDVALFERMRVGFESGQAEICSGAYFDREDSLRPLESQLWNLRKGIKACRELFGKEASIFARKRPAGAPQLPQWVSTCGIDKMILLPFDDSVLPQHKVSVIHWPALDGSHVRAFTRAPQAADSSLTYFHLAHYLSKTILQDPTACLALLHDGKSESCWYRDWRELSRLAPVFGEWVTLTRFFDEVVPGEYVPAAKADDFHSDYLHELTSGQQERPVSRFGAFARLRQRFDSLTSATAMLHALIRKGINPEEQEQVLKIEEAIEQGSDASEAIESLQGKTAAALAERLLSRAAAGNPGYLVLNPCHFPRSVGLELPGVSTPLPLPARATQMEPNMARVVVEVPAFGFAWAPRTVAPGTKVQMPRVRLAEGRVLRNDFFEAELDPQTGGLRVFMDSQGRGNRFGQQLVYGPGGQMKAKQIRVLSAGPALGEIESEGELLDHFNNPVANFRQRFRAWWRRPLLEMQIEIQPREPPTGYPWHAFYGARFAWRDDRAALFRAVHGMGHVSDHTRPESGDYLEIRSGHQRTAVFTGGLPFHQKHGQRMLDVILLPEGETARTFELALAVDLYEPIHAAMDFISPAIVVPTLKGPPHIGTSGWLFHLDASNVTVTSLCPAADGADAVVIRLLECHGLTTPATLRCPRDPVKAILMDERDTNIRELPVSGDAISLDFSGSDMQRVRVEFS